MRLVGGGIEQKVKGTYGHGKQFGDCWGEGSIKGLHGNRKDTTTKKGSA